MEAIANTLNKTKQEQAQSRIYSKSYFRVIFIKYQFWGRDSQIYITIQFFQLLLWIIIIIITVVCELLIWEGMEFNFT